MTQQALADEVNISQNSLSLIEDGLATPIHTKLILIQDYFQVKFKINGKFARIETFLEVDATSTGSVSKLSVTVSAKN